MRRRAIVIFEDQRGPVRGSPLADLLAAFVADKRGLSQSSAIKALIDVRLRKGNANVLKDCHDVERIASHGEAVIAVFDDDKVRKLLGTPRATAQVVIARIKSKCPRPDLLTVVLLSKNLESALEAARHCGVFKGNEDVWTRAVDRKELAARDRILSAVAWGGQDVRDCVLGRMASLAALVATIDACVP